MRRLIFPILLGLVGCAILLALGVWQMQRLAWKETMLARIEARIGGAPADLPAAPEEARDQYAPVLASGHLTGREIHVLVPQAGQSPAFRIIAALDLGTRRIMADLGTVPETAKTAPRAAGPIRLTGNLHWPDDTTSWTPAPDLAANMWYARPVAAMAEALDTEPTLLVARSHDRPDLGTTPIPVGTSGIPNDHFGYALTWFGLAFVWAIMSAVLIRRTLRKTP